MTNKRSYSQGQIYHIFNRGVRKEPIFHDHQDFQFFIKKLEIIIKKCEFKLLCYCLMPNHFHLCLRQCSTNGLSEVMHKLNVSYAMYYNNKYKTVGHVFQGRFKFKYVNTDIYLFYLSLYIHNNPNEFGQNKPEHYIYSSAQEYINTNFKNPICTGKQIILNGINAADYKISLGAFRSKKQHKEFNNLFE